MVGLDDLIGLFNLNNSVILWFISSTPISPLDKYRNEWHCFWVQLLGAPHQDLPCSYPDTSNAVFTTVNQLWLQLVLLFYVSKLHIVLYEIRTMPTQPHFIKALKHILIIYIYTQQMFYFNSHRGQHVREYLNAYHNGISMKHLRLRRKSICCAKSKRNLKG